MEVGIRELRADLSRFVKRVREGEEILVTDRGRVVARLVPAGETRLEKLIAAGLVESPSRRRVKRPEPPIEAAGTVSDIVLEDRR
jgi:prevent-host-death family protein